MSVLFKIKVTKEILSLSKNCGTRYDIETIGKNCAIAVALKDIFPDVFVTGDQIYPFGLDGNLTINDLKIAMPKIARDLIRVFDSLASNPNVRLNLPEFEFEISIGDEIISQISVDELRMTIKATPLLLSA